MSSSSSDASKSVTSITGPERKGDARADRLSIIRSMRKLDEEILRRAFGEEIKVKCASTFKAFGDCAKDSGMMVVFKCRQQNTAMEACMNAHNSDEQFADYLRSVGYS